MSEGVGAEGAGAQLELLPLPRTSGDALKRVDYDRLRIGDLVLVRRARPNGRAPLLDIGSHIMTAGQRWLNRVGKDHARWSHVAIYVGEGQLVEVKLSRWRSALRNATQVITLGGWEGPKSGKVALSRLSKYYPDHAIRFRRFVGSDTLSDAGLRKPLGPVRRLRIGIAALHQIGNQYATSIILRFIRLTIADMIKRREDADDVAFPSRPVRGRVICSTLFEECFFTATRSSIAPRGTRNHMTPALLSSLDSFADQRIDWVDDTDTEDVRPTLRWEDKDSHDAALVHAALEAYSTLPSPLPELSDFLIEYLTKGISDMGRDARVRAGD